MTEIVTSAVVMRVLVQVVVILLVAWTLGRVAERLGFTAVVGELLTGFVLGPTIFGTILPDVYPIVFPPSGTEILNVLGLLGLVLLLALVGLEIDISLIWTRRRSVTIIGTLGMLVPFIFGAIFGFLLPVGVLTSSASRPVFSLFLATALSISAIPVIARILRDLGLVNQPVGQVTIAAAMFTDTMGWILLSIIAGVARGGPVSTSGIVMIVGTLFGFLLLSVTIGQRVMNRLGPWVSQQLAPRSQLSVLVSVILGVSAVTWWVGLEPAIGAFVVGIMIARANAISAAVIDTYESVTLGVFAPIFFAIAGIRADLTLLLVPTVLGISLVLIVVATAGKFIGVYAGALLTGFSRNDRFTMGIGLNARGAIEFVIATLGLEFGILSIEMYTAILVMAIVTTVMTPPLLRRSHNLAKTP